MGCALHVRAMEKTWNFLFLSELERLYMVALQVDKTIFEWQSQTAHQADYQTLNNISTDQWSIKSNPLVTREKNICHSLFELCQS